ncbi:MAG TPA: cysteine hydrolase family protein [Bryobacteraceae bacterium]|nr:cysteine hydrolase family protein [Bryobacteraceae bacterium]
MKTVFFDIDTQIDFLYPAGALYVPGAEKIVPAIAELNRRAPLVISTMCTHAEDDPEFRVYPHHCVSGTVGQQKPLALLREKRAKIPSPASGVEQLILEKQELDCFSNPHLSPLLGELNADRYVVYGVVTEICVRLCAFGLLKTGKRVEIVTDAVKALDHAAAEWMFTEFKKAGGHLTTSAQLA